MEKKDIKNKAASKKAVSNKREPKQFGSISEGFKEFKIKKDFKNIFIKGDIVFLTPNNEIVYKEKGLI